MAVKRSKEELYGHDPELRRALDDLKQGKKGEDPMYLAPPADEPDSTFDADRFQEKTIPPGFLEFALTAKSPALQLEQEPPKPEKAKPSASIAGVPVYSAPMAPPPAQDPTHEFRPVLLAGDVRAEADPRRADTLLKIRIPATLPPPAPDGTPNSLADRMSARRLMRRILGVVFVLALVIVGATLALSPSASSTDRAPNGKGQVQVPVLRGVTDEASKVLSPSAIPATPAQLPVPQASSVSPLPRPTSPAQEHAETGNDSKPTSVPSRPESRPKLEPRRPAPRAEPKPARSEPALSPDDVPLFDERTMPSKSNATPRGAE